MTLANVMKLPADKFKKIVKSAVLAANKDQKALLDKYKEMKRKKF